MTELLQQLLDGLSSGLVYGASKAAFETLLECYAQETMNVAKVRVALVSPGATRTAMRARAYPGEDPASVKAPE